MGRRSGLLVTTLAMAVAAAGCTPKAGQAGGWTYSSTSDPISGDRVFTASHRFQPEQTPASYVDVELTCHAKERAAPDPFALTLTMTALGTEAKNGDLPPAKLADTSLDYRIDNLGGGSLEESAGTASRYSNEFRFSFAALYGASPQVGERLTKAMSDGQGGLVELNTYLGQAVAVENGRAIDAASLRGAQLNDYISNAALKPVLQPAMATVSNGFAWPFRSMTLRYKATVGQGTGEYVVTMPLNDPNVVRVANACGWGTGTAAPSTPGPAAPAGAPNAPPPAPGPSFGVIPVDEKGPGYRVLTLEGVDTGAAKLTATPTRPEAGEYCRRDPGGENLPLAQCVAGVLKDAATPKTATADCTTGRFTDTDGGRWQFGGRNHYKEHPVGENGQEDPTLDPPEYLFRGSEGLIPELPVYGYDAALAVIRTLCPASVRKP